LRFLGRAAKARFFYIVLGWKLRLEHSTVASLVKAGNTEEEPRRLGISATLDEVSTVLLHSSKEGERIPAERKKKLAGTSAVSLS